jgi:protein-S-isoprenylcysteine O-methyltransferase Ste14
MKIALQALASAVFGIVFFGLALFWPAGTFDYWQAWVFIAVFMVATMGPSLYMTVKMPDALRRRMRAGPFAEIRPLQKAITVGTTLAVLAVLVISAFDHRFGWSTVPTPVVIAGAVLVFVGLTIAQAVVIQNHYAGATITVEAGQKLASTGLYGLVRHPMYVGALIMLLGTPLALDSYWGLLAIARRCSFSPSASTTRRRCCSRNSTGTRSTRTRSTTDWCPACGEVFAMIVGHATKPTRSGSAAPVWPFWADRRS